MRSKKAIYNIITNILLQLVTIAYGFIVPKIIINKFGSDVNGLIASITQFLAYISLLESGFGPVVKSILYKPIARKDNKTIAAILKTSEKFFRRIALVFIIYIIALFFIYPIIIDKSFDTLFTISLIAIIGISTFAEYFFGMTYRLFLQAEQKTYITSIVQIITYILSIAAIVIMALNGSNVLIIKLVSGLIFILRPLLQNIYVRKKYHINLKELSGNYIIKQKWDGLAQHIAAVIHSNTDITVLTIFCTLTEVSVYSVYYLVVKGIKSLIQALANGIEATFGDMIAKKEYDNLNKKFAIYEVLYNSISTIAFSSAIVLITPFIAVYTKGVLDVNYNRPLFGALIVISEYIWAIRSPYSTITLAAGHFKQTRKGAWVECIVNIAISVLLVKWLGIVGAAIGTIAAMTIRTIEFIYHTNKYILKRSKWESIKKIIAIIAETITIIIVCKNIPSIENSSYLSWCVNAVKTVAIASIVVLGLNTILFNKEIKQVSSITKSITFKKQKTKNKIH